MQRTWIVIKAISKKEMEYLMKKGFKFHEDIFKTYSGKNKYYYRECNAINKALENYHNGLNVVQYKWQKSKTKYTGKVVSYHRKEKEKQC